MARLARPAASSSNQYLGSKAPYLQYGDDGSAGQIRIPVQSSTGSGVWSFSRVKWAQY